MRVLNPQQILSGAWQLFWGQKRAWFDLALVPLIWMLVIDLLLLPDASRIAGLTAQTAQAQSGEVMGFLGSVLLYMTLSLAIWSTFAAAWLRACLALPPTGIPGLSWSVTDLRVLGGAIRLVLVLFGGFALIMILFGSSVFSQGLTPSSAISFAFLTLVAMAPILSRVALVLPAAAGGQSARFADAWRLSKGNGLRLAFMLGALVVVSYVVNYLVAVTVGALLAGILGKPLTLGPHVVMLLVMNLMSLATSALVLAAVALCYRQLSGPGLQVVPQERDSA
ncbi:MAG: hypothetical protein AB7R90_17560 [Reyranellaceae bacterium]